MSREAKPVKIQALQRLAELIGQEVKELRGRVCVGPSNRDHKKQDPSLALVPIRFAFDPHQADEKDHVVGKDRSFGARTAIFNVGTWMGEIEFWLGTKTPYRRYELEHKIDQVFLGNAHGSSPGRDDVSGAGYLRPGIILIDVPESDNARCAFELNEDAWENEKVFSNQWYSILKITASIPALVRAKDIPTIDQLELSLTHDLETVVASASDADALPGVESIDADSITGNQLPDPVQTAQDRKTHRSGITYR